MRALLAAFAFAPFAACATTGTTDQVNQPVPAAPAGSAAADGHLPQRNERVRVVFPATATQPQRHVVGHLQRHTGDTVIIARGLVLDTVALSGGRQLQTVVGSHGHGWRGAGYGFLAGSVVGGIIGSATWTPCTDTGFLACMMYPSQGEQTVGGAILGGLLGGLIGGAIGAGTRTEVWGTVPLAGARVSITASGVGVHLAF